MGQAPPLFGEDSRYGTDAMATKEDRAKDQFRSIPLESGAPSLLPDKQWATFAMLSGAGSVRFTLDQWRSIGLT